MTLTYDTVSNLAEEIEREKRGMFLTRETVCTPEMVRRGLQLSERQWARKRNVLPWSYAFGQRSPRISWGQVLDFIEGGGGKAR